MFFSLVTLQSLLEIANQPRKNKRCLPLRTPSDRAFSPTRSVKKRRRRRDFLFPAAERQTFLNQKKKSNSFFFIAHAKNGCAHRVNDFTIRPDPPGMQAGEKQKEAHHAHSDRRR
jgi:hypothetical protein